jgi:hypothetical protein
MEQATKQFFLETNIEQAILRVVDDAMNPFVPLSDEVCTPYAVDQEG